MSKRIRIGEIEMSYFPMFIELNGKHCLVVGGGRIALRKVEVLKEFGAQIQVIAPELSSEIQKIEGIFCCKRYFQQEDLNVQELVIAATDDPIQNHQISQACKKKKIPVNVVDQIEDCSFIFPAYCKEKEIVAAFSSGGQSPVITQYLKSQMSPIITPYLGELAACFGSLREKMKQCTSSEKERKKIYQELLRLGLEHDTIPSEKEIEQVIGKYKR